MTEKGEIVWKWQLREYQVKHIDENNLSLFYDALEEAIKEVMNNYEVQQEEEEMTFDYDRWLESPYTDAEEEIPQQECDLCGGEGLDEETRTEKCDRCNGSGLVDMDKCDNCGHYECQCDNYEKDR